MIIPKDIIDAAYEEFDEFPLKVIQKLTAYKWAARAVVRFGAIARMPLAKGIDLLVEGKICSEEALEHAASYSYELVGEFEIFLTDVETTAYTNLLRRLAR